VTVAVIVGGSVGARETEHEKSVDAALQPPAYIVD